MKKIIFMITTILLMSGCASIATHISYINNNSEIIDNKGYATIVFFRPAYFASSGIPVTIIEMANNDNIKYVGQLFSGAGVLYKVKAGKYTFGISGETWSSLEVNAAANKYYYVALYPKLFQANFAVKPVRDMKSTYITHDIKHIKWIKPNDKAKDYLVNNANSFYTSWLASYHNITVIPKEFGFDNWLGVINK